MDHAKRAVLNENQQQKFPLTKFHHSYTNSAVTIVFIIVSQRSDNSKWAYPVSDAAMVGASNADVVCARSPKAWYTYVSRRHVATFGTVSSSNNPHPCPPVRLFSSLLHRGYKVATRTPASMRRVRVDPNVAAPLALSCSEHRIHGNHSVMCDVTCESPELSSFWRTSVAIAGDRRWSIMYEIFHDGQCIGWRIMLQVHTHNASKVSCVYLTVSPSPIWINSTVSGEASTTSRPSTH